METVRFIEGGTQSFYGNYLYELIVPPDHFLRKLNEVVDWEQFTRKLIRLYKGEGVVGRPPLVWNGNFHNKKTPEWAFER